MVKAAQSASNHDPQTKDVLIALGEILGKDTKNIQNNNKSEEKEFNLNKNEISILKMENDFLKTEISNNNR